MLWEFHGGPNQLFYFKKISGNKYYIINVATGFTIEVPENSMDDVQIHTSPREDDPNE